MCQGVRHGLKHQMGQVQRLEKDRHTDTVPYRKDAQSGQSDTASTGRYSSGGVLSLAGFEAQDFRAARRKVNLVHRGLDVGGGGAGQGVGGGVGVGDEAGRR